VDHYSTTGKPPGRLIKKAYSGIRAYAKMTFLGNTVVKVKEELFDEKGFFSVNPGTLDVFTFDLLAGDRATCFSNPNSILLSRFLAEKYFNSVDITNNQVLIDEIPYTIKGVFEDWPKNSHLNVNALLYSGRVVSNYEPQDWFDLEQYNYVLLEPTISQKDLNNKLEQLTTEQLAPILEGSGIEVKFLSQPLKGLYFESGLIDDVPKGNPIYVNALALAGLLVLLISGLNYINLSLTQSTKRSKEVLLKKILGMSRQQLLLQSCLESLVMTLLVLAISGILIFSFDGLYFHHTGFRAIDLTGDWPLLIITLLTTFLSGLLGTSMVKIQSVKAEY